MPVPLSDRKPNFDRLRAVLLRRGEPDYVPLFEVSVADVVMSGFMGQMRAAACISSVPMLLLHTANDAILGSCRSLYQR